MSAGVPPWACSSGTSPSSTETTSSLALSATLAFRVRSVSKPPSSSLSDLPCFLPLWRFSALASVLAAFVFVVLIARLPFDCSSCDGGTDSLLSPSSSSSASITGLPKNRFRVAVSLEDCRRSKSKGSGPLLLSLPSPLLLVCRLRFLRLVVLVFVGSDSSSLELDSWDEISGDGETSPSWAPVSTSAPTVGRAAPFRFFLDFGRVAYLYRLVAARFLRLVSFAAGVASTRVCLAFRAGFTDSTCPSSSDAPARSSSSGGDSWWRTRADSSTSSCPSAPAAGVSAFTSAAPLPLFLDPPSSVTSSRSPPRFRRLASLPVSRFPRWPFVSLGLFVLLFALRAAGFWAPVAGSFSSSSSTITSPLSFSTTPLALALRLPRAVFSCAASLTPKSPPSCAECSWAGRVSLAVLPGFPPLAVLAGFPPFAWTVLPPLPARRVDLTGPPASSAFPEVGLFLDAPPPNSGDMALCRVPSRTALSSIAKLSSPSSPPASDSSSALLFEFLVALPIVRKVLSPLPASGRPVRASPMPPGSLWSLPGFLDSALAPL